jgi:peptide/nickel transport system substrate-binding protein
MTRRDWIVAAAACAGCRAGKRPSSQLVLSLAEDRGEVDPAKVIAQDWTPLAQVYETLVVRRMDGGIGPCLATSWWRIDDVTWEFELRPGVVFHDGSALDARSAAESVTRAASTRASGQEVDLASVDTPGSRTLRIATVRPFAPLLDFLAYINFSIISPQRHGTGPFRMRSYRREDQATVVRNERYWGPKPPFSELLFRFIPDAQTRLLALEAGELDALRAVPTADLPRLKRTPSLTVTSGPGRHTHFLGFNMSWSPWRSEFLDPRFRQAFNSTVNRKEILRLFEGIGEEAASAVPPWMPSVLKLPPYHHDLRAAGELLDACGWLRKEGARYKHGKRLELRFVYHPTWMPQSQAMAELLQAQCARVGIGLSLHPADWPAANAAEREGQADLRHRGLTFAVGGTYFALWTAFSSTRTPRASIHCQDERIDALLRSSESAPDPSQYLAEVQSRVYQQHACVPLLYEHELFASRRDLDGFPSPHPYIYPLDLSQTRRNHAYATPA